MESGETLQQQLEEICQVSAARAAELLESASGSLQRAIEIHFASTTNRNSAAQVGEGRRSDEPQKQEAAKVQNPEESEDRKPAASKPNNETKPSPSKKMARRRKSSAAATVGGKPQSTLDQFLGLSKKQKTTPESKQSKLDSFFGASSPSSSQARKIESVPSSDEPRQVLPPSPSFGRTATRACSRTSVPSDEPQQLAPPSPSFGRTTTRARNRTSVQSFIKTENLPEGNVQCPACSSIICVSERGCNVVACRNHAPQFLYFCAHCKQVTNGTEYSTCPCPKRITRKTRTQAQLERNRIARENPIAPDSSHDECDDDKDASGSVGNKVAAPSNNDLTAATARTKQEENEQMHVVDTPSSSVAKSSKTEEESPGRNHHVEYRIVTNTLAQLSATSKRTIKLQALQELFRGVIESLGGITDDHDRTQDSKILTYTIDLVLGKLSTISMKNTKRNGTSSPESTISMSTTPPPLQVSGSAVSKAVQTVTGASRKQLHDAYRRTGDLGDSGAEYFGQSKASSQFFVAAKREQEVYLTVANVHETMQAIATVQAGKGSQAVRQNLLTRLLRSCQEKNEFQFLIRTLLGNMRIGATIKTVLVALENAVKQFDTPGQAETTSSGCKLESVFNICPRIPEISVALLRGGIPLAVRSCGLTLGYPIQPMLANPASSFDQVSEFVKDKDGTTLAAIMEWKYDGVRAQIHWNGSSLKIFSRHLLDCTDQFSEIENFLKAAKAGGVGNFILDAEVVAVSSDDRLDSGVRLLPFQDLSRRRGTKEDSKNKTVDVQVFCFDLLLLNGKPTLDEPFWKRRELMLSHFSECRGFSFAHSVPLPRYDQGLLHSTLEKAFAEGAEGLMIKLTGEGHLDGDEAKGLVSGKSFGYESGVRGKLWLKLKRDYTDAADTIDVVPIGGWHGSGRKAQNGFLSPILLAIYDDEEECFQSISRCMSFSDDMYTAINDFYFRGIPYPPGVGIVESEENATENGGTESIDGEDSESLVETTENPAHDVDSDRVNCFPVRPSSATIDTNENPPIWLHPKEVWEVSFSDMSLSRAHKAACTLLNDPDGRGVALRFPRFKRRRPDKSIEQATTAAQIATLFSQQSKTHASRR